MYILFELCWLVTGTVWVAGVDRGAATCDNTVRTAVTVTTITMIDAQVYMFSIVVIANFWIHILTPLLFMLALCCSKLGVCSCATRLWSLVISVGEHWTRHVRSALALGSILKH